MSSNGFSVSTTKSAKYPGRTKPNSGFFTTFAPFSVAACSASSGENPASSSISNSRIVPNPHKLNKNPVSDPTRSEERRVGKECRFLWRARHEQKNNNDRHKYLFIVGSWVTQIRRNVRPSV